MYESSTSVSSCYAALAALQNYRIDSRIPFYYQDDNCECDYHVHMEAPLGVKITYGIPSVFPSSPGAKMAPGLDFASAGYAHMSYVPRYSLHPTESSASSSQQQQQNHAGEKDAATTTAGSAAHLHHRTSARDRASLLASSMTNQHPVSGFASPARLLHGRTRNTAEHNAASHAQDPITYTGMLSGSGESASCAGALGSHGASVGDPFNHVNQQNHHACNVSHGSNQHNNNTHNSNTDDNNLPTSDGNTHHHRDGNENIKNGFMATLAELPVMDSEEEEQQQLYGSRGRAGVLGRGGYRGSHAFQGGRAAGYSDDCADMDEDEWNERGPLYEEARLRVVDNECDAQHIAHVHLLQRLVKLVAASRLSRDREHSDCVVSLNMSHTQLGRVERYADGTTTMTLRTAGECNARGEARRGAAAECDNDVSGSTQARRRHHMPMLSPRARQATAWRSLSQKAVRQCSLAFALIAPLLSAPGYPSYQITKLTCQYCDLSDHDAQGLAYLLQAKPSSRHACALKSVDWSYNTLTVVGAEYLKKSLKFNTALTELNLDHNPGIPANCTARIVIAQRLRNNAEGKQNCAWYHRRR